MRTTAKCRFFEGIRASVPDFYDMHGALCREKHTPKRTPFLRNNPPLFSPEFRGHDEAVTAEELRELCVLTVRYVRVSEALLRYAKECGGKPSRN